MKAMHWHHEQPRHHIGNFRVCVDPLLRRREAGLVHPHSPCRPPVVAQRLQTLQESLVVERGMVMFVVQLFSSPTPNCLRPSRVSDAGLKPASATSFKIVNTDNPARHYPTNERRY